MNKKLKKFFIMIAIIAICSMLSSNVFATEIEFPEHSTLLHTKKEIKEKYDETIIKLQGTDILEIEPITPKIGDYVRYTPDTAGNYLVQSQYSGYTSNQSIPQDTGLNWQVLSMNEDGTIDLVADRPISTEVHFEGVLGYNNGVYLLNDLCKAQYSNFTLGAVGRSINLVDIEEKMNSTGIAERNASINEGTKYGQTKTYSGNCSYSPDIYDRVEKTTEGESLDYYTSPTTSTYSRKGSLTIKQTAYLITSKANYYDEPSFHNLIFGTDTHYWLASRYVAELSRGYAYFGLRRVSYNGFNGGTFFCSNLGAQQMYSAVRPVVSLPPTVKLQPVDGTTEWEIVYNKIILGDVNQDGEIKASDAVLVLKYIAGNIELTDLQKQAADVNKDGEIKASDAVLILKYVAGDITEF